MAAKGTKHEPLKGQFADAAKRVEKLVERPSNDDLLALYGFYKQATEGDAGGSRPGLFDMKARAKYDAWASRKGMSKPDAMKKYVTLVERLEKSQA
jgi:acyl-CoA-binding protein